MTLVKYAVAMAVWALFYLIVAFAIAIGFGTGWRMVNSVPSIRFPKFRVKGGGNNGGNGSKAGAGVEAGVTG